jgi:dTDP-4-dehydrorhamnose 3,5-epimerase
MIFTETPLKGAYVIDPERLADERGFFARTWCRREFEAHGLDATLAQCSVSFNQKMGTLRGMHYQAAPHAEHKLVRCTTGIIYDVIVDLRPGSGTFRQWFAAELSADNRRMLYIPEGLAHGFLTLADNTEVFYQISEYYVPESARGVRWNDPAFAITWPVHPRIVSQRDSTYADFVDY